ncbi:MAG: hypothetical protein WCU88_09625 [Elusimicrobiota bacterium]|jgi:hypothetical protein
MRTILVGLLCLIATVSSAVPPGFNIQGRLTDSSGVNRNGSHSLKFTLFDASTGGTALWTKTFETVSVRNGNFQVVLGDVQGQTPLSEVFSADSRFLEIQVLSGPGIAAPETPLVPRQQLVSVPYSLRAGTASWLASDGPVTLPGVSVAGDVHLSGKLFTNNQQAMLLGGFYTRGSGPYQAFSVNPLTGYQSCPTGFTDALVFGSGGISNCSGGCQSWELHLCVKY